jgi:hypothetical protein
MQRLFSMFPTERPGFALLLMRVALAVMLMDGVARPFMQLGSLWYLLAPAAVAVALCLGFLTPVVSALCVLLALTSWATSGGAIEAVHVCAVMVAVALAMLGPGAYSLDARLFGRRQVILRPGDRSRDE